MSDWNCLTDRRSDADITENYLEKTKLWSRQTDRLTETCRVAQTSENFGSISRATEEERFTGKGNSHETSQPCATVSKIGILRDGRDDDAGAASTRTARDNNDDDDGGRDSWACARLRERAEKKNTPRKSPKTNSKKNQNNNNKGYDWRATGRLVRPLCNNTGWSHK